MCGCIICDFLHWLHFYFTGGFVQSRVNLTFDRHNFLTWTDLVQCFLLIIITFSKFRNLSGKPHFYGRLVATISISIPVIIFAILILKIWRTLSRNTAFPTTTDYKPLLKIPLPSSWVGQISFGAGKCIGSYKKDQVHFYIPKL